MTVKRFRYIFLSENNVVTVTINAPYLTRTFDFGENRNILERILVVQFIATVCDAVYNEQRIKVD